MPQLEPGWVWLTGAGPRSGPFDAACAEWYPPGRVIVHDALVSDETWHSRAWTAKSSMPERETGRRRAAGYLPSLQLARRQKGSASEGRRSVHVRARKRHWRWLRLAFRSG